MSASRRVAAIPELLQLISSHVYSSSSLLDLCLVNKHFFAFITPRLYHTIRCDERTITFFADEAKRKAALTKYGHHVRVFAVMPSSVSFLGRQDAGPPNSRLEDSPEDDDHGPYEEPLWQLEDYLDRVYRAMNKAIEDVCRLAPGLSAIDCRDVILLPSTLKLISSLPLSSLSITFPQKTDRYMGIDDFSRGPDVPLPEDYDYSNGANSHYFNGEHNERLHYHRYYTFLHAERSFAPRGLKRLSLTGLWGDIRGWRDQILGALVNSPNIEHLALSIDRKAVEILCWAEDLGYQATSDPEYEDGEEDLEEPGGPQGVSEEQMWFADMLRWLCVRFFETTGQKLQLKSLWLPEGIDFPDLVENSKDDWALETSHSTEHLNDVFSLTNLHDINIPRNHGVEGSHGPETFPKALIHKAYNLQTITVRGLGQHEEPAESATHLAAIVPCSEISLRFGGRGGDQEFFQRMRLGESGPHYRWCSRSVHAAISHPESPKVKRLLCAIKPEGYWQMMQEEEQSCLLLQNCNWIETLGFQVHDNLPREWLLGSICTVLSTLTSLKHLWIASAEWPVYEDMQEIISSIARACPHLTYLRLQAQGWRIHRESYDRQVNSSTGNTTDITFEALTPWEDEVTAPALFHVPSPLPWSQLVEHIDV